MIQDDHHHVRMLSERLEITIMDGRIGVLLRIDDPDQHVHQLHQPIYLQAMVQLGGVMIRQVQQYQPVQGRIRLRIGRQRVPSRDLEPVQQLLS